MAASRDSKKKPAPATGADLRRRRPSPERAGPERGPQGYMRADAGASEREAARAAPRPEGRRRRVTDAVEDAVTRAVQLGYKVAEEQLKKSQAATDSLQKASAALGRGDPGEAFAQTLHTAKAVGDMATHLLENASGNTQLLAQALGGESGAGDWKSLLERLRVLLGVKTGAAGPEGEAGRLSWDVLLQQYLDVMLSMPQRFGSPASDRSGPATRLLVVCDRLASGGTLSLSRKPASASLTCDGLVGRSGDQPALLDAKIGAITEAGGVWECIVKVGRGAAPGVYRGVVQDGEASVGLLELTLRKA